MICPCKTCPNKGCGPKHDTCELYLEWTKHIHQVAQTQRRKKAEETRFYKYSRVIEWGDYNETKN